MGFDAFQSVNATYMAQIFAEDMRVFSNCVNRKCRQNELNCKITFVWISFCPNFCRAQSRKFLMHFIPWVIKGCHWSIWRGGIHYIHNNILNKIKALTRKGIAIVICSQWLYERSDLSLSEVGKRILDCHVIFEHDMTTEAAAAKLMWALGKTKNLMK